MVWRNARAGIRPAAGPCCVTAVADAKILVDAVTGDGGEG